MTAVAAEELGALYGTVARGDELRERVDLTRGAPDAFAGGQHAVLAGGPPREKKSKVALELAHVSLAYGKQQRRIR